MGSIATKYHEELDKLGLNPDEYDVVKNGQATIFKKKWKETQEDNKSEPPLFNSIEYQELVRKANHKEIQKITSTNVDSNTPQHYDNSNGSLYKFAEDHKLNAYEFEVIKRIVRCRKKGEWLSDIDKTIKVLELYKQEQGGLYENQTEKLNK